MALEEIPSLGSRDIVEPLSTLEGARSREQSPEEKARAIAEDLLRFPLRQISHFLQNVQSTTLDRNTWFGAVEGCGKRLQEEPRPFLDLCLLLSKNGLSKDMLRRVTVELKTVQEECRATLDLTKGCERVTLFRRTRASEFLRGIGAHIIRAQVKCVCDRLEVLGEEKLSALILRHVEKLPPNPTIDELRKASDIFERALKIALALVPMVIVVDQAHPCPQP